MERAARNAGWVALSTLSGLPLWSLFAGSGASPGYRGLLLIVWIGALASRGRAALLAAVLPLGLLWAKLFVLSSPTAISESVVLAFASGATLGALFSSAPTKTVLGLPALALGAAIATSAAVELAQIRAVAPTRPFFADLWQHVRFAYWTDDAGNWIVLHDAVRWIAVLAAGVLIERSIRRHRAQRTPSVWLWLGASAAATAFTFVRVGEVVVRRDTGVLESIGWIFANVRLSVLHPDPNAAGSILAWLTAASLVIAARRRLPWMFALVFVPLAAAFAFAQSRAAVGALAAVLLARWLAPRVRLTRGFAWTALGALAVFALVAIWMATSRSHIAPSQALSLRVQMLQVGLRMAAKFPVFGVGLGDYARTSRRFITPDLEELAAFARSGENAHNNYLQVLVELGPLAFLAFVCLVFPPALAVWRSPRSNLEPEHDGLAVGLSAFLLSAAFGHPLLIPEVQAMFFVGLGLTAAHLDTMSHGSRPWSIAAWAAAAFFVASLLWRLG